MRLDANHGAGLVLISLSNFFFILLLYSMEIGGKCNLYTDFVFLPYVPIDMEGILS